jgi:hypothetical protein
MVRFLACRVQYMDERLEELRRRNVRYVFIGAVDTNRPNSGVFFAIHERSKRDLFELLRHVKRSLAHNQGFDPYEN